MELDLVFRMERIEPSWSDSVKKHNKSYEVTKDGRITVYPSLHESTAESKLGRILKKILHFKKGH
ncbi:MAG TPA: hypothetical protein DCP92_00965 [Nitrospiraceae bacterium]|nr:hypothetical protein [Nitrospiraceae bacterium]